MFYTFENLCPSHLLILPISCICTSGSRQIEILGRKWNFLTQYIFCRSRRDESIGGIKSEFYYLEHFLKIL